MNGLGLAAPIAGVGPTVLRLVRALVGPDPDLLAAHAAELEAERQRRLDARRDLRAAITAERAAHAETVREIEAGGGCTKVRLANEDEAAEFAADLAEERGIEPEEFVTFPCDHCPRRPLRGNPRWWHIGNADPAKRTGHVDHGRARASEHRRAPRRGFTLAQSLDPAARARLEALGPQ